MPTYEYKCATCKSCFEKVSTIAEMKRVANCPHCSKPATLQVSQGYTFGDEAVWINSDLRGSLQSPKDMQESPITTRSEYREHLIKNNIVERA